MIKIYTDGACSGNPGPGGWGVVAIFENKTDKEKFEKVLAENSEELANRNSEEISANKNSQPTEFCVELFGGESFTTNNRMELLAPIKVLEYLKISEINSEQIEFFTDSSYVKNGITLWIKNWECNGWKNSQNREVKNKDLWLRLLELEKNFNIRWNWIKGHAENEFNNRADKLARSQCAK